MPSSRVLALAASAFASSLLFACATTPTQKPAQEGGAEPMQAKAPDPFIGCQPQEQEGVSVLQCGEVVGVLATEAGEMAQQQLDQNLEQFQAQFPPDAKRERFTQKLGDHTATGIRVIQQVGGSPFRAELLIVPVDQKQTRIVSCAIRGTVEFDRCTRMLEALSTSGIPANLGTAPTPAP